MILVLILAGIEKLVNVAIASDKITQVGLEPLAGKTMRLNMVMPELHIDVVFNEDSIRFEPITSSIFENQNQDNSPHIKPDCSINVKDPMELLHLVRFAEGNLPIEGDYKVLMQVRELMAGFSPDLVAQLEPYIGVAFASQLTLVLNHLKSTVSETAKTKFNNVADWANDVTGHNKPDPELKTEVDDLHQQLLKLRSDVEREQAKLDAIKQSQQDHTPSSSVT